MMRAMFGCALLSTMLSCDNPPRSQAERRCEALEGRVTTLEVRTAIQSETLQSVVRRQQDQDKERTTAEAETAGLVAAATNRCPAPQDEPQWGQGLHRWQVNEPPSGLPEFKIYYGLGHEHGCLPETRSCPGGLPNAFEFEPEKLATCGYPATVSWSKLLRSALDAFSVVPEDYPGEQRVYVAYGLLQSVGGTLGYWTKSGASNHDFRTRVLPLILRSRRLTGLLYDWAMPHLQQAWKALKPGDQQIYLAALTHGQRYLATFSEKRELAYLEKLRRGQCSKPEWMKSNTWNPTEHCEQIYFTAVSPDGTDNPYRKLEAFFFRRARQGVKVADMRYWLDRVVAELRPLATTATAAAK